MKIMSWDKDGGEHSTVSALYIVEIKSLFSIVLLRFSAGSREAYHSHAFNCFSWVLSGNLSERHLDGRINRLPPISKWLPFGTYRKTYHKVVSRGVSWVISFRGPWAESWDEYLEHEHRSRTLTDGRIEL